MNDDKTKDWQLYEAGKRFNNRLEPNYYDTVDTNWAFFSGDQWRNLGDAKLPKPVFNIIKRVITFFVASLTSTNIKIRFEPLLNTDLEDEQHFMAQMATEKVADLLEKFKFTNRLRDALFDAAITGDACAHFYFDPTKRPYGTNSDIKGEICMEIVDGTNVFFGNGNNPSVDAQPYIIISGRDMVDNLREEAKRHRKLSKTEEQEITSDVNYGYEAGDNSRIEVEADEYGKAQYIIVYRRKRVKRTVMDELGEPLLDEEGKEVKEEVTTITVSKSVEGAYIYKDIDTGLTNYPIAWMNWEKAKNCYHGRAICTGILPNQIFINRMFAMISYHLMMTAFPKAVYNRTYIDSWNNMVGSAIAVDGAGLNDNILNVAGYLKPGDMSNQITQAIELAMNYTKETLGISDAALGNVKPDNTSAIIAVQKSSIIPLENPRANLYEWIEDIGKILFDMLGTYYGVRPIVREVEGQQQVEMFDFSLFNELWLNVKADVGEASYWSEIAAVQTMDNLLNSGYLAFEDYLERIPDEYIPRKDELIEKIRQLQEEQAMQQQSTDELIQIYESSPPEVQAQIEQMSEQGMSETDIIAAMQQPQPMG